jgi:hypothetical protein
MNIGGVSAPSTSRPTSSLVERFTGPSAFVQPRSRSQDSAHCEEGGEHLRLVLGGDHAEVAVALSGLRVEAVDLGADPADVAAIPDREPELDLRVLEERIALSRQRLVLLKEQGRDVVGVARAQAHRHTDEAVELRLRADRYDLEPPGHA